MQELRALSFPASYLEAVSRVLGSQYHAELRAAGLTGDELARPYARIDGVALHALLAACVARCQRDRPASVQLLERFSLPGIGMVGLLSMTANTLGQALDVFLPFVPLLTPAVHVVRRDVPGAVELRAELSADFGALSPVVMETFFGGFLQILPYAEATQGGLDFRFSHQPAGPLEVYQAHFGSRIRFGAPANTLRFDRRLLVSKLHTRSPAAHAEMLGSLANARPAHTERVRRQLERALDRGTPLELNAIARALALSPRTLNRRLHDEGTTLATLAGEARIERAAWLLSEGQLSVAEVAARVGYRDATSFSRAFKRARGHSPSGAMRR